MSPIYRKKRDLRRASDLSPEDVEVIFEMAAVFKTALAKGEPTPALENKALVMLFEKPSLRTRATFELGMAQLGGKTISLTAGEIGLGRRESVRDVARNLERWFDIGLARTFRQSLVDELADHCHIPFINGLSDEEHPCQALADYLTLRERFETPAGRRLTYIGDGNNICHSLIVIGCKLGVHVTVCTPKGYEPHERIVELTLEDMGRTGGSYVHTYDPVEAVRRADAIYTDVWASMGQEDEAGARKSVFRDYQVNAGLVGKAPKDALIMHDLPAHRGEEITDEVMDGPQCVAFDQAENRLHAQKGLLAFLLGESE